MKKKTRQSSPIGSTPRASSTPFNIYLYDNFKFPLTFEKNMEFLDVFDFDFTLEGNILSKL